MDSPVQEGINQIPQATCELVKDYFICKQRGVLPVKGKGEMEFWRHAVVAREPVIEFARVSQDGL